MPKIKGLGVVWGSSVGAVTLTGGAVLKSDHSNDKLDKQAQRFTHYDGNGLRRGEIFWDQMDVLSLRVFPSGTTIALAEAQLPLPVLGEKVTVVDAKDGNIGTASATAKKYICTACGKLKTYNSVCYFDITLESPDGADSTYFEDVAAS